NGTSGYTTLWVLASPPSGAHSVSVSFSGAPEVITAGSVSFRGVDQRTPYRNVAKAAGGGTSPRVAVASAPGNMGISALVAGCSITSSGQQIGWMKSVNCNSAGGNGAQSIAVGGPSVDFSYSINTDSWGLIGADVNAASSGP